MSDELKNILTHLNPDVDQETLMKYLEGKLTASEQHDVEAAMLDSNFDVEAMEGLENFKSQKSLQLALDGLKKDLDKKITVKHRRKKKTASIDFWLIFAVLLVLAIAIVGYFVVRQGR